jgi:DNA polymerase III subunit beta
MKIHVLQENLSKTLVTCSRFVSSRIQLPVLANILVKTNKNKLLVVATNLEMSIAISIGAKVIKEGEITVPSRVITDLVANLSQGQLDLGVENELLKIKTPVFESSLMGMNTSDFPVVPYEVGADFFNIPKDTLINALSSVLFAVSLDETRPALTGVLIILKQKEVVFVATDGFRLSQKKIAIAGLKVERKIILPKNALSELSKLAVDVDEVKFSFKKSENQVIFGVNDSVLATRVIEGDFPPYEKIIPKDLKIKIILDKEEFLRAVKLASVFAKDAANVIKISINESGINIFAESQTSGSQKNKVDAKVEGVEGAKGELLIAFNCRFVEDFLNAVKSDDVQMEVSDPNSPALFLDPKDTEFLHIIMPVKLQS